MLDRPLDLLNNLKGKTAVIVYKDGKEDVGKLLTFDIHINLVIEDKFKNKPVFIRAEDIRRIYEQ